MSDTKAVILAGGAGSRLRPYTLVLPKPLMPVGDFSVLEILLRQLRRSGIKKVVITLGHLGSLIRALCGDGSKWDLSIEYSEEPTPLGTIGPLRLIRQELTETFVVTNGDLVTDLDLRALLASHKQHGGIATVASYCKRVKIDLGVLHRDEQRRLVGFEEKPTLDYWVSMGTYVFEPQILDYVPEDGRPFGFDDLMHRLLAAKVPVYSFEHSGYWRDIGRKDDFEQVQEEFETHRAQILGSDALPDDPALS
jgi:NDP-sugar pyrophosphorylase family protein